MQEVWSQELQCYRRRNASQVRLKYTCLYLCSVRIVSDLRPNAATGRKPNVSLAHLIRCCSFTQGHSGVFRLLVVYKLRFLKTGTPTPLSFPNIWSDPEPLKMLNSTVLCSNFLSNNSEIVPILPSSESLQLDLSFLEAFNRSSL